MSWILATLKIKILRKKKIEEKHSIFARIGKGMSFQSIQ